MNYDLLQRVGGLALLSVMFGGLAIKRSMSAVQNYSLSALPIDAPIDAPTVAVANAVEVTKNILTGSTLAEPVASQDQPVLSP